MRKTATFSHISDCVALETHAVNFLKHNSFPPSFPASSLPFLSSVYRGFRPLTPLNMTQFLLFFFFFSRLLPLTLEQESFPFLLFFGLGGEVGWFSPLFERQSRRINPCANIRLINPKGEEVRRRNRGRTCGDLFFPEQAKIPVVDSSPFPPPADALKFLSPA